MNHNVFNMLEMFVLFVTLINQYFEILLIKSISFDVYSF